MSKRLMSIGTDGNDYRFVFMQLTNDTDLLVTQYKKAYEGEMGSDSNGSDKVFEG